MKTIRLNHLGGALLAAAAAGLLAVVGLVVVLYAQPAEANYPGKPGKIVYAEEHGKNFVIYTIKANGKGKLRLTAKGANNREPAYGPGGKRIAYSGYDGIRLQDLHHQGRRGKQAQHHQKFHGRPLPFLLAFQ